MFRVAVPQLQPGMKVGRSVVDAAGRILLTSGTVLKRHYIERLQQLGIPSIYVWNDLAPDVAPEEVVSDETRLRLATELKQTMSSVKTALEERGRLSSRRWTLDTERIRKGVNAVVDEVLSSRHAMVHLTDIRTHDEYTLGHSVNVCVLSTMVGITMGYNIARLRDLGLGAVLHDLGKVTVPEEILNKVEPLTPDEMAEMRAHAERGFEILRQQPDISLLSAHVAWQHHERWNGTGYPRALKGSEIHDFARIVAVADVYDAMTADRPYKKGYSPDRALRNIREVIADWFEPQVLAAFMDNIALYPIGTLVELTSGEIGVVVSVTRGQAERPAVRIIKDPQGRTLPRPFEVDLARDRSYAVTRVLMEPEQMDLVSELTRLGDAVFG